MRTHLPGRSRFVFGLLAIALLSSISAARAQDAGFGTFNDLVSQTIERPPSPQPSPTPEMVETTARGGAEFGKAMMAMPPPKKFFALPTMGIEYDYRFNQQKTGDRFETNSNEAHTSFSFFWAYSKLLVEYFHIWADASNDAGLKKTIDSNGVRTSLATSIFKDVPAEADQTKIFTKEILFTLPFAFKQDNTDSLTSTGEVDSETSGYAFTPFFSLSISRKLLKDSERKIKISLSPGFRVGITDKTFTNVHRADVHGWRGTFSLLPRIDYDLTEEISVYGSATWGHFTNVHSSDGAAPPAPNSGALATGINYTPQVRKKIEGQPPPLQPWTFSAAYQYDGFNRDSYQHSVTLNATYTF